MWTVLLSLFVLHGAPFDAWFVFDLKLYGLAGPCDGHILDGNLLHGRTRTCVCFPPLCLTSPLDPPPLSTLTPGDLRLMWTHLRNLSS